MFENVRADLRQYNRFGAWYRGTGFWATATYRFGAWAETLPAGPTRLAARGAHLLLAAPFRIFKDVYIHPQAKIGPGFTMLHAHNIIIPPTTTIGENCQIFHEVTLGEGPIAGTPHLGNNVVVYAGAKVLGGINVGDDVEIGANAVVIRDVDTGSMVAGPAGRAIPKQTAAIMSSPTARAAATQASSARREE